VVLVVEDDPTVRGMIGKILRHAYDVKVLEAAENKEALAILQENPTLDLIITDLMRAGGTGLDLVRDLRQSEAFRRIPVLVQSGNARKLELDTWRVGAREILEKPFTPEQLFRAVDRILDIGRDPLVSLILLGSETPSLDYKETVRLDTKDDSASLAKDVIAFANYGGGQIVIGVREIRPGEFLPKGLDGDEVSALEVTKVNKALRRYLDPPVHVGVRKVMYQERTFLVLDVPPIEGTIVLARRANPKAGLYPGRIYSRTVAAESAEVQSSNEVRKMISRLAAGPK